MASMHGPHHVAQNSRTTTWPFSASQLGRASDGACNSFSKPIGGGLSPTLGSLTSARVSGQTARATAPEKRMTALFIRLICELNSRKEIAHSADAAATTRRSDRRWKRARAETDDLVKPVAHKLNRMAPVHCSALVSRLSHLSKR